jgi:F0F1-type ATP synthase epsilon subunit
LTRGTAQIVRVHDVPETRDVVRMIAALRRGILHARDGGREMYFVTGEGVLEISGGNVTILADTASAAEDAAKARILLAST